MLIDTSYFTEGERQIMNAVKEPKNANEMAVKARIEGYIASLEDGFMRRMLGKELAALAIGKTGEGEVVEDSLAYKCLGDKLKESFAYYVFFHILRDMNHTATITGLVQLKCANSYVSTIRRQVSAWNAMVDRNRDFLEWVRTDGCPYKVRVSIDMLTYINQMNL